MTLAVVLIAALIAHPAVASSAADWIASLPVAPQPAALLLVKNKTDKLIEEGPLSERTRNCSKGIVYRDLAVAASRSAAGALFLRASADALTACRADTPYRVSPVQGIGLIDALIGSSSPEELGAFFEANSAVVAATSTETVRAAYPMANALIARYTAK